MQKMWQTLEQRIERLVEIHTTTIVELHGADPKPLMKCIVAGP